MIKRILPSFFTAMLAMLILIASSVAQAAPSITSVDPTSSNQDRTLDVKIRGSGTDFSPGLSATTFSGDGIAVNDTTVVDSTHAIANVTIDPDATPGARDVNVISGAETPEPLVGGFTVRGPQTMVTGITPSLGENYKSVAITDLAGSNFQDGASVKLMKSGESDIAATDVTVVSEEKITCDIDIDGADEGLWDVVVSNPDGESGRLNDGFEIINNIPLPYITLKKSGPDSATPGDSITYTFAVKNSGNDVLYNVGVTDSLLWDGVHDLGQLAQNETKNFEKTYTIPASTTESLENDATASGTDGTGTEVTDKNSHTVLIETGFLVLLKQGPGSAEIGDTVTYTFTVYNNSAEELTDVSVTDPLFGDAWSQDLGTLADHDSTSFTNDYTLTDADTLPLTNTATVTATDAFGLQISATDSYTLYAPSPPGSCTSNIAGTTMPPEKALWALLVLIPIGLSVSRWHRRVLKNKR